jgi:hypothetical protein
LKLCQVAASGNPIYVAQRFRIPNPVSRQAHVGFMKHGTLHDAQNAKVLTFDEARRITVNVAKRPDFIGAKAKAQLVRCLAKMVEPKSALLGLVEQAT